MDQNISTESLEERSEPTTPEPLVSVIVPTYNRADTLGRALSSISAQTYPNMEVLVVDDHSNDGTRALVLEFADRDPRFRYLENLGPQGPSAARNTGLRIARGDYVAFLESDDAWDPLHLSRSVALLQQADVDIVFSNVIRIRNGNAPNAQSRRLQMHDADLRRVNGLADAYVVGNSNALLNAFLDCRPLVFLTTVVYQRRALPQIFDDRHQIAEDLQFYIHLILDHKATFGFVDAVGTTKYEGTDSMSRWMEFDPRRYYARQLDTYRILMDSVHGQLDRGAARRLAAQTATQANNLASCYRKAGDSRRARKLYIEAFQVEPVTEIAAKAKLLAKTLRTYME